MNLLHILLGDSMIIFPAAIVGAELSWLLIIIEPLNVLHCAGIVSIYIIMSHYRKCIIEDAVV